MRTHTWRTLYMAFQWSVSCHSNGLMLMCISRLLDNKLRHTDVTVLHRSSSCVWGKWVSLAEFILLIRLKYGYSRLWLLTDVWAPPGFFEVKADETETTKTHPSQSHARSGVIGTHWPSSDLSLELASRPFSPCWSEHVHVLPKVKQSHWELRIRH